MITKEDKKQFIDVIKTQIEILQEINELYSENMELFKVLIDVNLEHIENLKMLIG